MRRALAWVLLAALAACVGPTDDPSQVVDLRVLGVRFEPPEVMAPKCDLEDPSVFLAFAKRLAITWLIEDPKGAGRSIDYEVRACANTSDLQCDDDGDFAVLAKGRTTAGELTLEQSPGLAMLADKPLLLEVFEQDQFKALGGLRMPIVIHLKAGDDELFAQKLMVFSCQFFPVQKPNVTPELPGMNLDATPWAADDVRELVGKGPFKLEPPDLTALQEAYVVPSFTLEQVDLVEAWKISWHATAGKMSPTETGGVDLGGQESRHKVEWKPKTDDVEQDVDFTFVVRDGRGGQSWLRRKAHWKP